MCFFQLFFGHGRANFHKFERINLHTMNFWPRLVYFQQTLCMYFVYHFIQKKKKTGLWTSKTRSYFCLQTLPQAKAFGWSSHFVICYWHAHRAHTHKRNTHIYTLQTKLCRHNSRAWINYWTWIRNSVDGQCTTWSSECSVSNEKNVRCRCLWPHTSFCIQQIGNRRKKITNRMRHTLARAAMLSTWTFLSLFHTTVVSKCKRTIRPIVYSYMLCISKQSLLSTFIILFAICAYHSMD